MRQWWARLRRDPAGPVVVPIVALALWCAVLTRTHAQAWASEVALWTEAATVSPSKPRIALNLGVALATEGHFAQARMAFEQARQLAQAPHVPVWDRTEIVAAATTNLASLDKLERALGRRP